MAVSCDLYLIDDNKRVIPYEIGTSFHPTPSDFAINGVYCRVLIVRKLCQVSLSYLKPYPRKPVRRLTPADRRGRAEIATSKTIDSSALTIELRRLKPGQVIQSSHQLNDIVLKFDFDDQNLIFLSSRDIRLKYTQSRFSPVSAMEFWISWY